MEIINEKDPDLWRVAQKRAEFKESLFTYVAVNGFFWLIWFYTEGRDHSGVLWPAWSMLSWGLWIAFEYYEAYHGDINDSTEREYEKMKGQKNQ